MVFVNRKARLKELLTDEELKSLGRSGEEIVTILHECYMDELCDCKRVE